MKIFLKILIFMIITALYTYNLFSTLPAKLALGFDLSSFNNSNQITFNISKRDLRYWFIEDDSRLNLELGLRLIDFKNPSFIYNFSIIDGNFNVPYIGDGFDYPGSRFYSNINRLAGGTIFKVDKTNFEDLLIDYFEYRDGIGFCSNVTKNEFGPNSFFLFLTGKLGWSSLKIDSLNYINEGQKIHYPKFKTGLNLKTGFSFNEYSNIKTDFDYSVYFFENILDKFNFGIKYENIFHILYDSKEQNNCIGGYIKVSIGANYLKYNSSKYKNDILMFNLSFQYLIPHNRLPNFLKYYDIPIPDYL